jgi:hypothetical protein
VTDPEAGTTDEAADHGHRGCDPDEAAGGSRSRQERDRDEDPDGHGRGEDAGDVGAGVQDGPGVGGSGGLDGRRR